MDAERFRKAVDAGVARIDASRLLAIVGPTATGKTDLAIAIAERVRGEIVSADSVQVYRGFDIGSGKPTAEERSRAPHHLIDVLRPDEPMDAAEYGRSAAVAIEDIRARGRVPILCGGTFFWVRALVLGLVEAPAGDEAIRARHRAVAEAEGREALHAELARIDPATASRLHPNDLVRVSRALEVFELSGRPLSAWHEEHGFRARKYEATMMGLTHDPTTLDERITRRASTWLAGGWVEEVEGLLRAGFGETRAMRSVGYKEVQAMIEGRLRQDAALAAIASSTRIFARRQRTWLRRADVLWM